MVWQVLECPELPKHDLSSVTHVLMAVRRQHLNWCAGSRRPSPRSKPGNGYGMTETSALCTSNSAEEYLRRPDSVGCPAPVTEIKIVDSEGRELPAGAVGELWVKGPNVVKGYWNKPEPTAETFTEGWLHTGDLARIDEEGYLYIVDRAKDMLIRGGENIYCVEVEDALYSHPAVMDAAVFGAPHRILGEEPVAVVQIAPGHEVTEEDLKAYVRQHLAHFKVPVKIELRREPLPRNPNGKILKRQLKEEFIA